MHAIKVYETGGPEVMQLVEVDDPTAGQGQLLVEVSAAGVNYVDTYQRSGIYPRKAPFGLGMDGVGVIRELGPGVDGFNVGQRVVWSQASDGYAELVAIAAEQAVLVPDALTDEQAVGAFLQGMTAHVLVTAVHSVARDETILAHAAAGGVGLMITQLASSAGARVIGTVSTAAKAELARGAGATDVINYTEVDDLAAEVRALTGGAGVAAVYDGVGRTTFDASLASLRTRGILVLFGAASGPVPPVDPQRLNAGGSLFLTRPSLIHYTATREELEWHSSQVFDAVAAGSLDVHIGHRYPLADARRAHEELEGRATTGKLILVP